jgi:predicted ester cyclase
MSLQKNMIAALARDLTARRTIDVASYFSRDFLLHDPNAGAWPRGHDGARKMLDGILAFAPDLHIEPEDMIEEGDRVAVRWRVSGTRDGEAASGSIVAIYRFVDRRIVEDWGIAARVAWP